jgi:hypothetical protein
MNTQLRLTVFNWRYWMALPIFSVFLPVLLAQMLCRSLARLFYAADEAIERRCDAPVNAVVRFVQQPNKQQRARP